jgi:hypothetical protein
MVCVHLSGLCPNKQGCRIRFWGGSTLRVHSVSHSGGMVLWVMAGRRDLRLNVEFEPWLRGLVFTLPKFYLTWNWRCQSEQKESAHGSDWASSSQPCKWDHHIPLMNSMEQSPWEAHSLTASSENFYVLWNPDAYYRFHKSLLLFSVLARWILCTSLLFFFKAHFNIILPPLPRSTQVWQNRMSMSWVGGCELFEQALIWVSCLALVVVNILVNAVCWTYCEQSFVSLFSLLHYKRVRYI